MNDTLDQKHVGDNHLFSNDSDEEYENDGRFDDYDDDFISFPTIPDPDQEHSRALTKIFTKTLRKVSSNASHLVQNYSGSKSRTSSGTSSGNDKLGESPVKLPTLSTTAIVPKEINNTIHKTHDNISSRSSEMSRATSPKLEVSSSVPQIKVVGLESYENQAKSSSSTEINNTSAVPSNTDSGIRLGPHGGPQVRASVVSKEVPRVTSDNKSLRLSTMRVPQLSNISMNNSATSSVINVNALASTEKLDNQLQAEAVFNRKSSNSSSVKSEVAGTNTMTQKEKQKVLQNRISSIFNNLPNDIELSDDSASDTETINISNSSSIEHSNRMSTHENEIMLYNEPSNKSPITTRRSQNASDYSPVSFSNNSSKRTNRNSTKQKSPSNLPSVIFDNAKSIINYKLANGAISSASSIITSNKSKKKKKPRRSSENPLKNGGIPKKYWMNDSFVSDCLNCFKPFTAFRRKHHCRFCGQIFCSDCTLFISYNRHKEERKLGLNSQKKHFNDKLRVCKACYTDVIVYLSDDSTSSSPSSDDEMEEAVDEEDQFNVEENLIPQYPLARIRSLSISSRRESLINESNVIAANKGFINKDHKSNLEDKPNDLVNDSVSNGEISSTPFKFSTNLVESTSKISHPKQAPQMAIPATRKGEAVEIPIPSSSYASIMSNSNNHGTIDARSESMIDTNGSHNTSWFKNYAQLKNQNISSDSKSNSLNNHIYNTFLGNRNSNKHFRNLVGSDKDYHSVKSRQNKKELRSGIDSERSSEVVGLHEEPESENEDEQVMSLYTSLNHIDSNNSTTTSALTPRQAVPHALTNSSTSVVPTLGEFPTMFANDTILSRNETKGASNSNPMLSKLIQTNNNANAEKDQNNQAMSVVFDDRPNTDNLRSHERAHASLLRMRSRRKSKSVRNVSILTHNNNRLSNIDQSNFVPSPSPISTQGSPTPNTQSSANMSNLTRGLSGDNTPTFSGNLKTNYSSPNIPVLAGTSSMYQSPTLSKLTTHTGEKYSFSKPVDSFYAPAEIGDSPSKEQLISDKDVSNNITENTKPNDVLYKEFLDVIMIQCLEDCEIKENQERWRKALNKVLAYISYIRLTDTLDIKQYVKIKKILGGEIEETSVIDGMFITKNIDSKRMSSKIENPRIALLMFPLEYLKQKEQFISLRIVHSQQSVYITNLVSRLISLEPDVIIVGDSVCGLAERLLEEANITVISNTKPQIIERISRYTKANIFQSINDLFFKKGSLGSCENFEVKRYQFKNIIKTFIFFTGGDIESGFTISLRGGEENVLNSIKYVTETLIIGAINTKFEISLFDSHGVSIIDEKGSVSDSTKRLRELEAVCGDKNENYSKEPDLCNISIDEAEVIHYMKIFDERKLSVSPAVSLKLPTPLINTINSYTEFFKFFKKDRQIQNLNATDEIDPKWLDELKLNINIDQLPNKTNDLLSILKYTSALNLKSLISEYQARARIWSNCMTVPSYQLYPVFHKCIHFLHSTVSIKYATPCSGPSTVVIDYYTDNDKCLGLFLDQIFRDSLRICDECGEALLNHYKTYVHGNGKLDIIIEKYENVINEEFQGRNQRLMWSCCKECDYTTPVTLMSDETYYLSVGKFFELCYLGENVVVNNSECKHDFFKSHIRYFALNDLVIRLEYSNIDTYEVVVPKKQLEYVPDIDIKLKIDTFNSIQKKTTNFFQSVSNRLNRVKVDTFDKAEDGIKKVEELKLKLDTQIESITTRTYEIYNSTISTVHLPLNSILRELQELGVIWDNEFNEFEKNFLPTENEITKITQFHLKKFLMDKYNSDDQNKPELNDNLKNNSEEKKGIVQTGNKKDDETGKEILNKEKKLLKDEIHEDRKGFPDTQLNKEKTKEIGKMIPSSLYHQSNVVDKINKMEALLEEEKNVSKKNKELNESKSLTQDSSPLIGKGSEMSIQSQTSPQSPSPNQSHDQKQEQAQQEQAQQEQEQEHEDEQQLQQPQLQQPQNKVSQLANFFNQMNFDQISMEFRKQREAELQKKLSKFKAIPIVASKPIVEIYNKIEDVVDVADETDVDRRDTKRALPKITGANNNFPNRKQNVHKADTDTEKLQDNKLGELKGRGNDKEMENDKETENDKNRENYKNKIKNLDIPQPEKNSLLKSLTNFWADRSATLWDPLEYPLDSNEHTFADSDVIVREDEPSSLVAFCLSSHDYKQKIKSMADSRSDVNTESNESTTKNHSTFSKIEKKFKKKFNSGDSKNEFENIMTKNQSNHLKYQYLDGNTNLSCKIFYSEQFDAFRKACGNDDTFIQSLSRCIKWNSSGGKSGSNFLKTLDTRYILKELSKSELESFVAIAPFYFKYIAQFMFHTLTTAVAKIFGFYQIQIKNTITGKTFKMDFLIMENLFYNHHATRIFDLKGSMRNRHVKQTGKENEVLLDENMIEYIYESPVFVKEQSKKLLRGSLFNDTSFLSAMDVMDYSLIIGIDDSSKKLYIGIIDWLRTFTWDKKVENWVKGNNLIGGGKKGKDPTIVTPKQYRTRFREAMERYILEVPDFWYEGK